MKYTLITLAALSSAAFAQTYNAGDVVTFSSVGDLASGSNGTVVRNAPDGWLRAVEPGAFGTADYALNAQTGQIWDYQPGATGTVLPQAASWLAGSVNDFDYSTNSGRFQVRLSAAAAGYAVGDVVTFNSVGDLVSNANGTVVRNAPDNWLRAVEPDARGTVDYALNTQTGQIWDYQPGTTGAVLPQAASWLAGSVNDFDYDTNTGRFQVRLTRDVTVVPEPSSAALLGLGGLALILRRRK